MYISVSREEVNVWEHLKTVSYFSIRLSVNLILHFTYFLQFLLPREKLVNFKVNIR